LQKFSFFISVNYLFLYRFWIKINQQHITFAK